MKKMLAALLAAVLMICGMTAWAQTRDGVIVIEGMEEKITETFYESVNGYAVWYPEEWFTVTEEYGHERFVPAYDEAVEAYLMVVPVDIPVEESEALIHEATGGYMEGEAEIGGITGYTLESGLDVKTVQVIEGDMVTRFYLVTGNGRVFCLTAGYPLEAAEGFGARIDAIVNTFETIAAE